MKNGDQQSLCPILLKVLACMAVLVSACCAAISTSTAWAELLLLGDLAGGGHSSAAGVSPAGSYVVGSAMNSSGHWYAVRWTSSGAIQNLGFEGGAWDVSAGGSVVAGSRLNGAGVLAVRWTPSAGMQDLGTLGGGMSEALAVSSDGNVIAGWAENGSSEQRAFRWTQSGGMTSLGTLGGNWSVARDVSANGSVIVGSSGDAAGSTHAFRWTASGGMADIGGNAHAEGVSGDGSVVVGWRLNSSGDHRAFRWISSSGMVEIGTLGGDESEANAVSGNGQVIVGTSEDSHGNDKAFRWTASGGMVSVRQWLADSGISVPAGFSLRSASGVSDDGSLVVGTGRESSGSGRAWLARGASDGGSPETTWNAGFMTDFGAFQGTVNETGAGAVEAGIDVAYLALYGAHHRTIRDTGIVGPYGIGVWATGDAAGYDETGTKTEVAEIGIFKDIASARLGIGIGQMWARQDWSNDGRGEYDGTYFVAEADWCFLDSMAVNLFGYYGKFDSELKRRYANGAGMDSSKGRPDIESYAWRIRFDWLDALSFKAVSLNPYGMFTWVRSEVDSYTERGGGFPAHFDSNRWTNSDLRIGAALEAGLASRIGLRLACEAVHSFDDSTPDVEGEVLGLWSFDVSGDHVNNDWVRIMADLDFDITEKVRFTLGGNAATAGGDPTWGVTAGLRLGF